MFTSDAQTEKYVIHSSMWTVNSEHTKTESKHWKYRSFVRTNTIANEIQSNRAKYSETHREKEREPDNQRAEAEAEAEAPRNELRARFV